jgi:hypothetical protein
MVTGGECSGSPVRFLIFQIKQSIDINVDATPMLATHMSNVEKLNDNGPSPGGSHRPLPKQTGFQASPK